MPGRSLHRVHGKWAYVNGEARVTWDDGAMDAIRRVGGQDKKFAYRAGKSFTDEPDNVTDAKNTTPASHLRSGSPVRQAEPRARGIASIVIPVSRFSRNHCRFRCVPFH